MVSCSSLGIMRKEILKNLIPHIKDPKEIKKVSEILIETGKTDPLTLMHLRDFQNAQNLALSGKAPLTYGFKKMVGMAFPEREKMNALWYRLLPHVVEPDVAKRIQEANNSNLTLNQYVAEIRRIVAKKTSSEGIKDNFVNLHKLINRDPGYVSKDFDTFANFHVNLQKGFEAMKKFMAKKANT